MADPDRLTELPRGFTVADEHPQVQMPFTIQLAGRQLMGKSLSLTRAVANGLLPKTMEGQRTPVTFRFDLTGFSVSLFLETVVDKSGPSEDAEVSLHFLEPTGSHLATLRYLLNSYIAGDLATVDGMMGYTGPTSIKAKTQSAPPSLAARFGSGMRKLTVAGLTAGLAFVAATLVHERVIHAYEPLPVTIEAEGQLMRATAGGQMTYVDATASSGDVLYSIASNSGDFLSIQMPCDCVVVPTRDFANGATVLPGTPLARLVQEGGGLVAQTEMTPEGATRLLSGDKAELVLADGSVVPVDLVLLPTEAGAETVPVELILPSGDALKEGDTARLRFARQIVPTWVQAQIDTFDINQFAALLPDTEAP